MSKLSELIAELCPNGVEFRKLKDVSAMQRGASLTKSKAIIGDIPVISGGREPAFYCESPNRTGETITIAGSGAGAGYVQYWNTPIFANDCFTVKGSERADTKYLYYFLTSIQGKINEAKKGGGVPHVHVSDVENFCLPLPPIDVQREIVKILDKFTQLQAELQAELELQLKRLEEVRNDVLCRSYMMRADKNSHLVRLGDIGKFERCTGLQKNDLVDNPGDGLSPCLHYGQIYTYYGQVADVSKSYCDNALAERMVKAHKGDLVVATTSENLEDVGTPVVWNGNSDWAIGGETYVYRHNQNPIFLANQFMTHNFFKYKQMRQTGTKVVRLNDKALSEYQIWLPSIDIQDKIAKFLHAYDLLVNDISNGLPAEIKLRQQQYEYYRDELLSFKLTNV